jgi:hypothetical protein
MYCIKYSNSEIVSNGSFCFNRNNDLYISDTSASVIRKIDNSGNMTTLPPKFNYPQALLYDNSNQRIYVMDSNAIYYVKDDGSATKTYFAPASERHGPEMRYDSNKSIIYCAINQIYKTSPVGESSLLATRASRNMSSFALDNSDNIYILDASDSRVKMMKLDSSGEVIDNTFIGPGTKAKVWSSTNILNNKIYLIGDGNKLFEYTIGGAFSRDVLSYTTGVRRVEQDNNGNLYVYKGNFIYRLFNYTIGNNLTNPSISSGVNSLIVSYDDAGGVPTPTYYYSLDSSGLVPIGAYSSPITIPNVSRGSHRVSITAKAFDSDLNLVWFKDSSGSFGIPYILGSVPSITSIVPGTNRLTVSFTDSSGGYTSPTYYYSYSSDGSNRVGPVTSPFTISDIKERKTVYIVATNMAGTVISAGGSGTPYIIGSTPIVKLNAGKNKLIVTYSQLVEGTSPTSYYYSLNGGPLILANTSPFEINGLTSSYGYTVYILARNRVGDISSSPELGFVFGGYPYSMNLQQYCDNAVCQKQITYSRVKTGVNDPSISKKMQYARYVRGPVGKCTKVLDANGDIIG